MYGPWLPKPSPSLVKPSSAGHTAQWESKINVWFRFMYSQKWNCAASLFPKQNYNVCLPISTFMYLWAIYIFPGSVCLYLLQPNRPTDPGNMKCSQIHKCRNWEWGCAVSFMGINKIGFSVQCRNNQSQISLVKAAKRKQPSHHCTVQISLSAPQIQSVWLFPTKNANPSSSHPWTQPRPW